MKSLLEMSWCHPFGPRFCNITDVYHYALMHTRKHISTLLNGAPQKCFKLGPALAKAEPVRHLYDLVIKRCINNLKLMADQKCVSLRFINEMEIPTSRTCIAIRWRLEFILKIAGPRLTHKLICYWYLAMGNEASKHLDFYVICERHDQIWAKIFCIPKNMNYRTISVARGAHGAIPPHF